MVSDTQTFTKPVGLYVQGSRCCTHKGRGVVRTRVGVLCAQRSQGCAHKGQGVVRTKVTGLYAPVPYASIFVNLLYALVRASVVPAWPGRQ